MKKTQRATRRLLEALNWCLAAEHSLRSALAFPQARRYWEHEASSQLEAGRQELSKKGGRR